MPDIKIEVGFSAADRAAMEALTAALVASAAAGTPATTARATKPKAEKVTEPKATETKSEAKSDGETKDSPAVTRGQVNDALREYAVLTSKADAIGVMKAEGGVSLLSELPEDKFATVLEALAKAKAAKAEKPADPDDF